MLRRFFPNINLQQYNPWNETDSVLLPGVQKLDFKQNTQLKKA